jgi:hypothetical protein
MPKQVKKYKKQRGKFLEKRMNTPIQIKASPAKLIRAARVIYEAGLRQQSFQWALTKAGIKMI